MLTNLGVEVMKNVQIIIANSYECAYSNIITPYLMDMQK